MNPKILVVYASQFGSTADVAKFIGQVLQDGEGNINPIVEVRRAQDMTAIGDYQAVVVGSAIRFGRCLPEIVRFLKTHEDRLSQVPVAYFQLCGHLKDDTPERRREAMKYLDAMQQHTPRITPVATEVFAGKVDLNALPFSGIIRLLAKLARARTGDWRDWQAIGAWAGSLSQSFSRSDNISIEPNEA